ncbi:MAG: prepilin-type N-terminal cleavage/methylation domain-containing protein [Rhodobacteraceae bacterium]|nr:prepilin-type N-terminal cleavage/methylation domain-containing protein [Paracoccaceae bacterium]
MSIIDKQQSKNLENSAGFTLIEMLVVLFIIALSGFIFAGQFSGKNSRPNTEEILQQISNLILEQRLLSITTGKPEYITIDFSTPIKTISTVDTILEIPNGTIIELLTTDKHLINSKTAVVQFNPDGSSSGGAILLINENSKKSSVEINWLTGIPTLKYELVD